jgi:hypothetical protein
VPARFAAVGEIVREFLGQVRESQEHAEPFMRTWSPGGPWRPGTAPTAREEGNV